MVSELKSSLPNSSTSYSFLGSHESPDSKHSFIDQPPNPNHPLFRIFPKYIFSFCICSERSLNECLTSSHPRWLHEYVVTPFCFQKGSFTLFSTECSRLLQKLISDGFAFSGSTWSLSFISTFPIPVPSSSIPRTLLPLCL